MRAITSVRLLFMIVLASLLLAPPAQATFSGQNGKIAFSTKRDDPNPGTCTAFGALRCNEEIYTVDPDGSHLTRLTVNPAADFDPAWSPDGTKIAFASARDPGDPNCDDDFTPCNYEIYVMNADGSGQTRLTISPDFGDTRPKWTPDGRKITFTRFGGCYSAGCDYNLVTMNADGTSPAYFNSPGGNSTSNGVWSPDGTTLAFDWYQWDFSEGGIYTGSTYDGRQFFCCGSPQSSPSARLPDWSPDQSAIVFWYQSGIAKQNVAGSGFTVLRGPTTSSPEWSPDGKKILFATSGGSSNEISVMDTDGSGETAITSGSGSTGNAPSWQPLQPGPPTPGPGFARPKGATPFQTYLTIAYKQCVSPDEQHGAPLAVLSCNPPQQESMFLTVGTLDSNGQQAKAVGVYRLDVKSSPSDVKMTFALKDVRNKLDLTDYTGELRVTENWRITDKNNGPIGGGGGTDPGTNSDIPFPPLDVACAATTSDPTVGSTCNSVSSANAIVPGSIQGGTRMNSELGQVQVQDGGSDGVAATTADNTLFMDQGIFAP